MWERIKALEENGLKVSKALAKQSLTSILFLMGTTAKGRGQYEPFSAYMFPKADRAEEQITRAGNSDEVIKIIEQFSNDCINFTAALLK